MGEALSIGCQGHHRHIELTGGGRTRRADVYPDELCEAILTGLVNQMKHDDRIGSSFKACDQVLPFEVMEEAMFVNEVNWAMEELSEGHALTWSRKDYGTSPLMLPGPEGPLWSSCTRRLTRELDTGMIIEDTPVSEVTGRGEERVQRRR